MAVPAVPVAPDACPLCGTVPTVRTERGPVHQLTREVARMRAVAEQADGANLERIGDLEREVQLLRETVARLRGSLGTTETLSRWSCD